MRFTTAIFVMLALPLRAEKPDGKVTSFVEKYCMECHDKETQKGEREFESFVLPLKSTSDLIAAKEIIDQVTLKEMPPKKADQPTDQERLVLVTTLRDQIASARGKIKSTSGRTVIRRLSHREYENTLATLFDRRVDTLGLTADFPREITSHHLDNIGEALTTSGFLLDQYFLSANRLVEARLGRPEMEPKTWHFKDHFKQYEELSGSHKTAFNYRYLCLYEQPNTDTRQGGYGHIEDFLDGVPVSGLYDIEVLAQALHRNTHYDPDIFRIDLTEPFVLGIVPGDVTKGHIHYPQTIEPLLAQSVVPDDKPEWLTFRVWLEGGQTPRFIFPNGPYESRASVLEINKKYKDEFKDVKESSGVGRAHILLQGALPHIRISEIKIKGPISEKGGSREELAVFGQDGFTPGDPVNDLFAFAGKAFRRPLTDQDRKMVKKTYERQISESSPPRQAALDTVKMILCSPSFLYLSEATPPGQKRLNPHDLASRLSYTLWAGPPDDELLEKAASGKLAETKELLKQGKRLLADERSQRFASGFLDSWLNLRDLGGMPPPRESARQYYYQNLPFSMKEEIRLFFQDLLRRNGSVIEFLDSDYTFVDKYLAQLYQLPEQDKLRLADGFQKVSLSGVKSRGGVLGMAGILTLSANGVETSPVTRGVWVSENILGVVPPPPPDEVPAIDADVRGATTIREKLEKHRADKACAECHRKIDPLGFSLENYDPIGRLRSTYPSGKKGEKGLKIDSSGEFPSGESYGNFQEFKKILVESRKEVFTRNLISKLLDYSTGRHMEVADQFEIDDILKKMEKQGYGLQTLVLEVLNSEIFRSP